MRQVAIPKEAYTGTCNQLFDFLAIQLADFIKEQESGGVGLSRARQHAWSCCCCLVMLHCATNLASNLKRGG